ncbi:ATP-dependent DNA helicase RecG [Corynebacterium crudilactis]|uniref:ATP-dependent DNA helicase RecG n=1 Tax=Corynebacterium crudilactis TaxID=1652495 RepID=UPI0009EF3A66|nr:ATP-dependent DNA helicase RecG [Corynebacterium crudilactis]
MQLSPVDDVRLRGAVTILAAHGIHTPAIDEGIKRENWPPLLVVQALTDVHFYAPTALQLGVDMAMLPPLPTNAPEPGTIGGAPKPTPASLTSDVASILAPQGEPILFDYALDSLRGVPLTDLDGVGESNRENLDKANICSVWDLLMKIPLRYLDRSELTPMSILQSGQKSVTFIGEVISKRVNYAKTPYARFTISDGVTHVSCMFFRATWMGHRFKQGDNVLVHGDVTDFNGFLSMSSPIMESLSDTNVPLLAIYPQSPTHQVTTWLLRKAALDALRRIPRLDDPIPTEMLERRKVMGRLEALQAIHVPESAAQATRGRERIVYDEFLRLQLALGVIAHAKKKESGIQHRSTGTLVDAWRRTLPYALTGAQDRAIADIRADLHSEAPMNRLLQGDVGAGKTAVLIATALMSVEGGHQAVIIAPSEILARQHFEEISEALTPMGIQVDLLVSKALPRPRKDVLRDLADGTCKLAVGTHSLLQDTVDYHQLGVVVIDEQHRFGVDQRAVLSTKGAGGKTPDTLQATATPIPRTSAITVFGDMDVSILDEKPPGRSPIVTQWIPEASPDDDDAECWQAIRGEVARGRQAFVVCPLVQNSAGQASETKMAASAESTAEELRDGALQGLRIGVVHGKLKPADRSAVMTAFVSGDLDVLVATTVIEVGVSVPNATVMVVLDACKFGLAQLHQLRGRVGRGKFAGQCWLGGEAVGDGQARMEAMCGTDDGFKLSALDLEIRGPGSLISTAQAGKESGLVVADLIQDEAIHMAAREDAQALLARDPSLARHAKLRVEVQLALGDQADYLLKS